MKTATKDIVVGIFYELPDGRIAYTYGFNDVRKTINYHFDEDNGWHTATYDQLLTWTPRRDLKDFPNARDPRLPYTFDLYWDIKYMSQLRQAIQNNHDELDAIRQAMVEHNITL